MSPSDGASRRTFLKSAAVSTLAAGIAGPAATRSAEAAEPATTVPRRPLGTTGETVPILLMGCAQKFDPKYDKLLHRAFKQGVDYLDTALSYADGQSHKTIAPFIKQVGDRSRLWITSKGRTDKGTVISFQESLDTCLEQLETDYLDLYFMHAVDDPSFLDPPFLKMGEAMRASGKTRFFGFSCHGDHQVECMQRAAEVGGIDAIMFRYSFARYGDLELNRAIDACVEAGIGLIAMKTQDSVPGDQEEVERFESANFNLHQAKLKAVWADDRIAAVVSHMDNTTKLAENVEAARSPLELTMAEMQQLQRIATRRAAFSCQGCSHLCESRVEGELRIARSLRYLMYAECYGEAQRGREAYARLSEAERAFDHLDLSEAERACPQGIRIAERLHEARRVLA